MILKLKEREVSEIINIVNNKILIINQIIVETWYLVKRTILISPNSYEKNNLNLHIIAGKIITFHSH